MPARTAESHSGAREWQKVLTMEVQATDDRMAKGQLYRRRPRAQSSDASARLGQPARNSLVRGRTSRTFSSRLRARCSQTVTWESPERST